MLRFYSTTLFFFLVNNLCYGQSDTIEINNGMYLIRNSLFSVKSPNSPPQSNNFNSTLVYGNPEFMDDRILLDSNKNLISLMANSNLGYAYYDWNNKHSKTYEEIQVWKDKFKLINFYDTNGQQESQEVESTKPFKISYANNIWKKVNKIRIELDQHATDSLYEFFNLRKSSTLQGSELKPNARFWKEINFYDSGKIKSAGIFITSSEEDMDQCKIGTWSYYNLKGKLENQEEYKTLKKSSTE